MYIGKKSAVPPYPYSDTGLALRFNGVEYAYVSRKHIQKFDLFIVQ